MGDRLTTIYMDRKVGAAVPLSVDGTGSVPLHDVNLSPRLGDIAEVVGDGSPLVEYRDRAMVGGLGMKFSRS